MQNNPLKRYAVLYRDHNGEIDTQYFRSENVERAGTLFKEEHKHTGNDMIAIAESTEGCNMYLPRSGTYIRM